MRGPDRHDHEGTGSERPAPETRSGSMREAFPGYFRPTGKDFDRLWNDGMFVMDTNVLLNLYRYSRPTRDELLEVLRALRDKLFLPHQVGREFLERRLSTIRGQREKFGRLRTRVEGARESVEDELRKILRLRPEEDLPNGLEEALAKVPGGYEDLVERLEELEGELPRASNSPEDDEAWALVAELFEGKVGPAYDETEAREAAEEAERRQARKIPPGFRDERPGDYLLWRQTMDEAKRSGRPVVIVTDDRKDDWWWTEHNETLGPRRELVAEMRREAGVPFHMYTPDRLMAQARERLGVRVSDKSIFEAEGLGRPEEDVPARKSQVDLLRVIAKELQGEGGVEMFQSALGKPISRLTRAEADAWIDHLTPYAAPGFDSDLFDHEEPFSLAEARYPTSGGFSAAGMPLRTYARRLLEDLMSGDFDAQNRASAALRGAGPRRLAEVDAGIQEGLGRAVLSAAEGNSYFGSFGAGSLVDHVRQFGPWPAPFMRGMILGALVDGEGRFRPKGKYLARVVEAVLRHDEAERLLARAADVLLTAEPSDEAGASHGPAHAVNGYDEAAEILRGVRLESPEKAGALEGLVRAVRAAKSAKNPEDDD